MRSKIIPFIFWALLTQFTIYSLHAAGQQTSLKGLNTGDHIPDILLKGFLDDTSRSVSLKSLYQHKLLVLDFWGTWCAPCVRDFPKLDSLQQRYRGKIEIVAVGYEPYDRIAALFNRQPSIKPKHINILTNDQVLSLRLFKHVGLPHLAWIDSTGKIIMTTGDDDLSGENIDRILKGDSLHVRQKIDVMNFNPRKPFHYMDTVFKGRSIFTGIAAGVLSYDGMGGSMKNNSYYRRFILNSAIGEMYLIALYNHRIAGGNMGRLILEIRDSLKFMGPRSAPESFKQSKYKSYSDWAYENLYCYDITLPRAVTDSVMTAYMVQDLNRYFNLYGRYEIRNISCYVLKKSGSTRSLEDKSAGPGEVLLQGDQPISLTRQPVSKLVELINQRIGHETLVDDTGIKVPITIDVSEMIKTAPLQMGQLNTALKSYGLKIQQAHRKLPVFVVSESK